MIMEEQGDSLATGGSIEGGGRNLFDWTEQAIQQVSPRVAMDVLSFSLLLGGLLWTSNRRMRKAFNRRKSSRRLSYSPYSLARADSELGTNSSPKPNPFLFVNNPRSFSASPISSTPSPLTTPLVRFRLSNRMNLEQVEVLSNSSKGAALYDLIKQSLISPTIY